MPTAAPTKNFLFLTFFTSNDCFFIFSYDVPIPPSRPIAKAILLSVTVSIAEDKKGTFNSILSDSFKLMSVFEGESTSNVEALKHHQRLNLLLPYKLIYNYPNL